MRKKKLAIFAEKLYGGGVERILQTVLRNLDYNKYDVSLYSSHAEDIDPAFYPVNLKNTSYFSSTGVNATKLIRLTTKIINKIKLLIYYHCPSSVFYKLFIRRRFDISIAFLEGYATRIVSGAHRNTKKIAWLHTDIINYHWTNVAFRSSDEEKSCYQQFSKIVCVAESVKSQADKYLNTERSTTVIYNPIDRERVLELAEERVDDAEGLKKYKTQLLIVGTLNKNKGQLRLLHALAELLKKDSEIGLWIVGDGEYRNLIQETIAELKLKDHVALLGFQKNPYPFYKKCDIYVCASYAEGFNTAITEALIFGKPVVATLCSGVEEQLGRGCEYGLIANNDDECLYKRIEQMLNPQTLAYYRQKSEERGQRFCISESMKKIDALLQI